VVRSDGISKSGRITFISLQQVAAALLFAE
jgi:hypothetical protein